jgi:hypothetical protein
MLSRGQVGVTGGELEPAKLLAGQGGLLGVVLFAGE